MSWFTKKKSSKPFLMNWTRLLLKCLATKKNHPAANSPPPPPPSISWFLYKIFREIIFTKNLHYFPLYTPPILLLPSPKNCTINIPYFVVLLFSYYLIKKKEYPIRSIISWLLFMWNQNLLICYSHGSYFFAMICSNSRNEKKFLFWSIPNVQKSHIYKTKKILEQERVLKFYQKKNSTMAIITTTQESATTFKNQDMNCHLIYHQNWKNFFQKENPQ